MSTNFDPTCPVDCSANLPAIEFSACAPEWYGGQIKRMFVTKDGNDLDDWLDGAEWVDKVSNSSNAADAIRVFTVVASLAAPEKATQTLSDSRIVPVTKRRTMNIRVDEINDSNYSAARQMECGGRRRVWFGTDEHIFGGNEGILMDLDMDLVIPESEDELQTLTGTGKWNAKHMPERAELPFTYSELTP